MSLAMKARQKVRKRTVKDKVFGCDLLEHLQLSGQEVPQVLKSCAEFVEEHGVVDGIYRLCGISSNVQKLRQEFDVERTPDLNKSTYLQDVHCVSSLCKAYFRELPNPLLTYQLYDQFAEAVALQLEEQRLIKIREVLKELPLQHYRTLEYLMKHLLRMASHSAHTNMHTRNLAIVWAPNLLRSKDIESSGFNGTAAFMEVRVQSIVVEFILTHVEQLFGDSSSDGNESVPAAMMSGPGCVPADFYRSLSYNLPSMLNHGDGPPQIRPYHTIIEISDHKRKGSLKGKKWKSIFNLGRSNNDSKRKSTRHEEKDDKLEVNLRPAKSMDSLSAVPCAAEASDFQQRGLTRGSTTHHRPLRRQSFGSESKEEESFTDAQLSPANDGKDGQPKSEPTTPKAGRSSIVATPHSRSPKNNRNRAEKCVGVHISGPFSVTLPFHITSNLSRLTRGMECPSLNYSVLHRSSERLFSPDGQFTMGSSDMDRVRLTMMSPRGKEKNEHLTGQETSKEESCKKNTESCRLSLEVQDSFSFLDSQDTNSEENKPVGVCPPGERVAVGFCPPEAKVTEDVSLPEERVAVGFCPPEAKETLWPEESQPVDTRLPGDSSPPEDVSFPESRPGDTCPPENTCPPEDGKPKNACLPDGTRSTEESKPKDKIVEYSADSEMLGYDDLQFEILVEEFSVEPPQEDEMDQMYYTPSGCLDSGDTWQERGDTWQERCDSLEDVYLSAYDDLSPLSEESVGQQEEDEGNLESRELEETTMAMDCEGLKETHLIAQLGESLRGTQITSRAADIQPTLDLLNEHRKPLDTERSRESQYETSDMQSTDLHHHNNDLEDKDLPKSPASDCQLNEKAEHSHYGDSDLRKDEIDNLLRSDGMMGAATSSGVDDSDLCHGGVSEGVTDEKDDLLGSDGMMGAATRPGVEDSCHGGVSEGVTDEMDILLRSDGMKGAVTRPGVGHSDTCHGGVSEGVMDEMDNLLGSDGMMGAATRLGVEDSCHGKLCEGVMDEKDILLRSDGMMGAATSSGVEDSDTCHGGVSEGVTDEMDNLLGSDGMMGAVTRPGVEDSDKCHGGVSEGVMDEMDNLLGSDGMMGAATRSGVGHSDTCLGGVSEGLCNEGNDNDGKLLGSASHPPCVEGSDLCDGGSSLGDLTLDSLELERTPLSEDTTTTEAPYTLDYMEKPKDHQHEDEEKPQEELTATRSLQPFRDHSSSNQQTQKRNNNLLSDRQDDHDGAIPHLIYRDTTKPPAKSENLADAVMNPNGGEAKRLYLTHQVQQVKSVPLVPPKPHFTKLPPALKCKRHASSSISTSKCPKDEGSEPVEPCQGSVPLRPAPNENFSTNSGIKCPKNEPLEPCQDSVPQRRISCRNAPSETFSTNSGTKCPKEDVTDPLEPCRDSVPQRRRSWRNAQSVSFDTAMTLAKERQQPQSPVRRMQTYCIGDSHDSTDSKMEHVSNFPKFTIKPASSRTSRPLSCTSSADGELRRQKFLPEDATSVPHEEVEPSARELPRRNRLAVPRGVSGSTDEDGLAGTGQNQRRSLV